MKLALLAPFVFAASLFAASVQADTMAYPSADNASFMIDYPSDWEMTPADEVGGYTELTGPTGATLYFRTIPGTEAAMQQAISDTREYLGEAYSDLQLSDAKDTEQHGLKGFFATGSGTDEEAGEVGFLVGWYGLKDGNIGEIWFVVAKGDESGASVAGDIINSFRAP